MADSELVLSLILVFITFFLYGLKWAVLIAITLFVFKFTIDTYSNVEPTSNSNISQNFVKNKQNRSGNLVDGMESYYETNSDSLANFYAGMDSNAYGREIRGNNAVRNPWLTQDLPFTGLQMCRNRSQSQRNTSLKSPEPLLSQVTRHLSFSNTWYYQPDGTRHLGPLPNDSMTILNNSRPVSSHTAPKWYNHLDTTPPYQRTLLDTTAGSIEERYSPMKFSITRPQRSDHQNTSTVRMSRPGDTENDSRFALESILHKRLERTKDNPCSRQSVLSALGQKSRKRSAHDSDSSMVESYAVKKRRRDELDDFLDSVNNPLLPRTAVYTSLRTMKRPYHEPPTFEMTSKRIKESGTRLGGESSPMLGNSVGSASEDSGLDLNSPPSAFSKEKSFTLNSQAKVVQPARLKKRKSVTFSDNVVDGPCDGRELPSASEQISDDDGSTSNKKTDSPEKCLDNPPLFHTGFSPRKSLTPEYLASISNRSEKKKIRRRLNITWKDLQENRREAWRRSQKLLDEIEESLSKERESTTPSVVTTPVTSPPTQPLTSLTVTSLPTQPLTSLTVTSLTTPLTTSVVNSLAAPTVAGFNVQPTIITPSRVDTHSQPMGPMAFNTLFSGFQNSPVITQSGTSSGQTGKASGIFATATPKNSSASSSITGIFSVPSTTPSVSSTTPSLLSSNTSSSTAGTRSLSIFTSQASTLGKTVTQSSATSATKNTATGLFSFNPAASKPGNTVQNSTPFALDTTAAKTVSSIQPNAGGFSASAANPTSGFTFTTSAVTTSNVSGGFTFTTQAGGKIPGNFTFAMPANNKPNASGSFKFTAPTNDKPNASGGFKFTAPTNDKPNASGSFKFTAPTNDKPNASGGFNFTAPSTSKPNSNGGFQFNGTAASSVNSASSTFTFTPSTANNSSGGFAFNAPAVSKPTNSSGFNFGNQSTPASFNFGSPVPAAAGGFSFAGSGAGFASSTPVPQNSGKTGTATARTRQRRRTKK